MPPITINQAIRAHIQDGKHQHPEVKPFDAYPSLLHDWAHFIQDATTDPDDESRVSTIGRLMLQVAGMMIRAIEELELPLTPPKETE